jgi:hypothetical protein
MVWLKNLWWEYSLSVRLPNVTTSYYALAPCFKAEIAMYTPMSEEQLDELRKAKAAKKSAGGLQVWPGRYCLPRHPPRCSPPA